MVEDGDERAFGRAVAGDRLDVAPALREKLVDVAGDDGFGAIVDDREIDVRDAVIVAVRVGLAIIAVPVVLV